MESISGGGAARIATQLANLWTARGKEVLFVTFSKVDTDFYLLSPAVERHALDLNTTSRSFFSGVYYNACRILAVRKILKKNKPNIVIGFQDTASIILAFSRSAHKECLYFGAVRNYPPKNRITKHWHFIRRYSYKYLDSVITQTFKSADWISTHTKAKNTDVIPNFINWPIPIIEPKKLPSDFTFSKKNKFLAVGSLRKIKGFDMLISAFYQFTQMIDDWELIIVGEGNERSNLEEQCVKLGIDKKVIFPGQVGNISDWYDAADVFILSSRSEGFPGVLVEAMASGLPVISFDCDTGPRDIILNRENGVLVTPESISELNKAMIEVVSDQVLMKKISDNARNIIYTLSPDSILDSWHSLFEKRLSKND